MEEAILFGTLKYIDAIIKYKIQINCLKNKWKSVGFKIPGNKKP